LEFDLNRLLSKNVRTNWYFLIFIIKSNNGNKNIFW
jgi:hypothetical protein